MKGYQANVTKIAGWLQMLTRMALDIVEVTANTLLSPIAGTATLVNVSSG